MNNLLKAAKKAYESGWWKTRANKEGQLTYMFIEGVRFAQRWHVVGDKENPIPNEGEVLIRLEDGSIRRYDEDWGQEFGLDGIVTHWQLVPKFNE